MKTVECSDITYTPKDLEEWGLLVDRASGILSVTGPDELPTIDQAEELLKYIDELDDETMEAARLHGLGYLMVPLARVLRDPESREEIVVRSSELLGAYHFEKCGDEDYSGLHVMDMQGSEFSDPFEEFTFLSRHEIAFEKRFIVDCLQYASLHRRSQKQANQGVVFPELPEDMSWLGISASLAGRVAPQAASTLYRAIILRDASRLMGLNYHEAALVNPLILSVHSPSEIGDMDLLLVARGTSKLRLDEFRNTVKLLRHIISNADGIPSNYGFNSRLLKQPSRPVCNEVEDISLMMLHESRNGCPARFVKYLFELILKAMPEIYLRADQFIKDMAD